MVTLLSRGVGGLVRALAGINCVQATRCSSVPNGISDLQCTASRWFSKSHSSDDHPKQPLSAYVRYSVEQRPILHKQYPGTKLMDLTKIIALEWKGLPASAKEPYEAAAIADRQTYREELRKYKEKLTPLQLEVLKEEKRQKLAKRKHIRKKRELTLLGRPKGPRSAFNIFMSEHFQEAKGSNIQSKLKSLHDDWIKLHDSQKQTYIQLAEDDKIRYENEMKSWEDHMIEIGREDLVRHKQRRRVKRPSSMRVEKVVSSRETTKKQHNHPDIPVHHPGGKKSGSGLSHEE
ncbi:transcription factor A, mitochondrial [Rhinophrynus dorsalis]